MIIKAVIDKSKNCNPLLSSLSAYLSFSYDDKIINYLRNLEFRYYDADNKTWEIQEKDLVDFCKCFGSIGYNINVIQNAVKEKVDTSSYAIQIPEDYKFQVKPYDFQREGIIYGLNHPGFLLADDMGCGKTLESLHITNIECKGKVLVIVCSASLKYNWKKEVKKHLGQGCYILGKDGKGDGKSRLEDLNNIDKIEQKYIVTNVETLSLLKFKKGKAPRSPYSYPIAEKINELCSQGVIDGIIIDEFHLRCKSVKSHSSKALSRIKDCKYKICMTGTPVVNTPLDVFTVLKWVGALPAKVDFWQFSNTFAIKDEWGAVIGYQNLSKLSDMLRSKMLRRERDSVIELPGKIIQDDYIDMSVNQFKLYKKYTIDVEKNLYKQLFTEEELARGSITDLRKIVGDPTLVDPAMKDSDNAKLTRLKELVEEITLSGSKVIIYSNWTMLTNKIRNELEKYNPVYITGEVKPENRDKEIDRFEKDDSCKVLIGTIGAMGIGLNITCANYGIFYDLPWTKAEYDQAVDRMYRIGQTKKVIIYNLLCKKSIDVGISALINGKGQFAQYMTSGSLTGLDNNKLIECIMNEAREDKEVDEEALMERDL